MTVVDVTDATPPSGPLGCPVTIRSRTIRFSRSGRATVSVLCPNGCRADFQLFVDPSDHRFPLKRYIDRGNDGEIADGKLRIAAGATPRGVRVTIVKQARALVRRHPTFRVYAVVPTGLALGPEIVGPNSETVKARRR